MKNYAPAVNLVLSSRILSVIKCLIVHSSCIEWNEVGKCFVFDYECVFISLCLLLHFEIRNICVDHLYESERKCA